MGTGENGVKLKRTQGGEKREMGRHRPFNKNSTSPDSEIYWKRNEKGSFKEKEPRKIKTSV